MTFVAEAFGGWLVGQVADATRKGLADRLLGSDQERALQKAATAAIKATAQQFRPGSAIAEDALGADHLARVIDHVFRTTPMTAKSFAGRATLLQGLQIGVAAHLAVLGDTEITGTGESSSEVLGVPVPAVVETLTRKLLQEIIVRGATGGPLTSLADQLNHDLTHLKGQQLSASLARLTNDLQTALATLDRLDQRPSLVPAKTPTTLGRPVRELTDPFSLEVHRAIDVPGGIRGLPVLPAYVAREHDYQLRVILKKVINGHSAAAVLVGGSSTGKTRACWEAVQTLPPEWRLWHPIDPSLGFS